MEKVIQSVAELSSRDRGAIEHIMGTHLKGDEQLTIRVERSSGKLAETVTETPADEIPEAWKIYEGLSDSEIDKLDEAIRQRANLSRAFE
jgi:hypothetical protein